MSAFVLIVVAKEWVFLYNSCEKSVRLYEK